MYVAGIMAFRGTHPMPGNAVETFHYPSTRNKFVRRISVL